MEIYSKVVRNFGYGMFRNIYIILFFLIRVLNFIRYFWSLRIINDEMMSEFFKG